MFECEIGASQSHSLSQRGLYSHSCEQRKYVLHISQILEGNYFGAYTCRACIRTRANAEKYSWGIICVLVLCQGVLWKKGNQSNESYERGEPLKPYHFKCTLGAQKASSKYCQSNTCKQREL